MGIGDLFKGYVFFKILSAGIGLVIAGFVFLALSIKYGEISGLLPSVVLLLIGALLLYISLKILRGEREKSGHVRSSDVDIGYSRKRKYRSCPKCGKETMKVEFDGSAICTNCSHATEEYVEEKN